MLYRELFLQLVLDVSNNLFSGSIPPLLFANNSDILTFCAVNNCLDTVLPETLCQATALESLILDGMGSNTK